MVVVVVVVVVLDSWVVVDGRWVLDSILSDLSDRELVVMVVVVVATVTVVML